MLEKTSNSHIMIDADKETVLTAASQVQDRLKPEEPTLVREGEVKKRIDSEELTPLLDGALENGPMQEISAIQMCLAMLPPSIAKNEMADALDALTGQINYLRWLSKELSYGKVEVNVAQRVVDGKQADYIILGDKVTH